MRTPTMAARPRKARLAKIPAPVAGLIANRSLAVPNGQNVPPGAAVLRNWFPTASGCVLRRGSITRVSTGSPNPVKTMWRYVSGSMSRLFAATDDGIWDVTTATPVSSGLTVTNGDWSVVQFSTAGGTFLVGVNGVDAGWIYDGAAFSAISLTGVSSAALSYVWAYKQRLYFIQTGTLDAWYLPVDQIGGTVTKLPLGGVFQLGGSLMWGQTWSLDSAGGGGMSEQNVFMSSEGEAAVFQGLSPDDAASWNKVGIYRTGRPLGKHAIVRAGGDLLVATSVGLVSLAESSRRDMAALGAAAVSYPVEDRWRAAVAEYGVSGWACETWPEGQMILIAPPAGMKQPVVFVVNSNTGAWAEFTGWKAGALKAFNGGIFFGTDAGMVKEGWQTGSDDGLSYVGQYLPLFDDFGIPACRKIAQTARVFWRSAFASEPGAAARANYDTTFPPPPPGGAPADDSLWNVGLWNVARWGGGAERDVREKWFSVGGSGEKLSVAVQFASGSVNPVDVELIEVDLAYTVADIVT